MARKAFHKLSALLLLLLVMVVLYFFSRIAFYTANSNLFVIQNNSDLVKIIIGGFRFDLAGIFILNIPFAILFGFIAFNKEHGYLFFLKHFFVITNSIALFSNFVDVVYYPYTLKRSTIHVFDFFTQGGDLYRLLPTFLLYYWYIFIAGAITVYLLYKVFTIIIKRFLPNEISWLANSMQAIILIGIFLILCRGGIQLRPINSIDASKYTKAENIPLVLNTPFSIIKSIEKNSIEPKKYFSEEVANSLYSPIHKGEKEFKPHNVVILILESFSKEYIGYLTGKQTYTPFLDSLLAKSFCFENGYANGKKSIEGIPAILASIPTLMEDPFISSPYSENSIESIATCLKRKKYQTAFFHGGTNGTMNFNSFAAVAGFDSYIGRTEYANDTDYDGRWGIWDEPFLQYSAKKMNEMREPFLSTVFTLSSHHPYSIPTQHKNKFTEGKSPIHKCVQYTDYSLQLFFNSIEKMPWYKNTVFVIVADHTGILADDDYNTKTGQLAIPIAFYCPNDTLLLGKKNKVAQQIDIMPSLLSYLNYDEPYFSFGFNLFDNSKTNFALSYSDGIFQAIDSTAAIYFDGKKTLSISDFKNQENEAANTSKSLLIKEKSLKAFLQTYDECMVNNRMTIKRFTKK
ncbi:MAG: sulfatase-like hydrolase/transferase [Bacteroidetes bacterium]|nr:sulfatase-like hydrolase/transferase [Bacteroidota bacterium]